MPNTHARLSVSICSSLLLSAFLRQSGLASFHLACNAKVQLQYHRLRRQKASMISSSGSKCRITREDDNNSLDLVITFLVTLSSTKIGCVSTVSIKAPTLLRGWEENESK